MRAWSIQVLSENLKTVENKTEFSITFFFLNYKTAFKRSETEKIGLLGNNLHYSIQYHTFYYLFYVS